MAEVFGVDEMLADLAGLNAQLAAALPRIVLQAAALVQREVQQRAPVDTGALRASIDMQASQRSMSASATVQAEDSAQGGIEHYAVFKEYGTSTTAAEPFFRPGLEAARVKVDALLNQEILNVVASHER